MSKIFNRRNALIGWAVWLVAKRQLRKKAKQAVPIGQDEPTRRRFAALVLGILTAVGLVFVWRKLRGGGDEGRESEPAAPSAEPTPLTPRPDDDDIPPAA
jgi:hypothetical protein